VLSSACREGARTRIPPSRARSVLPRDERYVGRIVQAIAPRAGEILEIGAGKASSRFPSPRAGARSSPSNRTGDSRRSSGGSLSPFRESSFEADALRVDFRTSPFHGTGKLRVVGTFPTGRRADPASAPRRPRKLSELVLMFQSEVAERLTRSRHQGLRVSHGGRPARGQGEPSSDPPDACPRPRVVSALLVSRCVK
jgi:hypothetical protein